MHLYLTCIWWKPTIRSQLLRNNFLDLYSNFTGKTVILGAVKTFQNNNYFDSKVISSQNNYIQTSRIRCKAQITSITILLAFKFLNLSKKKGGILTDHPVDISAQGCRPRGGKRSVLQAIPIFLAYVGSRHKSAFLRHHRRQNT